MSIYVSYRLYKRVVLRRIVALLKTIRYILSLVSILKDSLVGI